MSLTGTSLVGGSVNYERVENDFYATDPQSVRDLFDFTGIHGEHFYEPCVGQGHIAEVIKDYYPWRDGASLNPKTGKKWGSTMCFAWFVWEVGYKGDPIIKWL